MPGPSGAWATTIPHGSMTMLRPWVGNAGADAALSRGDHEGPVLDRPGPQQHLPVVPAGGFGEVGRHRQNFRPTGRQLAIQLRESQVEADAQAQPHIRLFGRPLQFGHDGGVAGGYAGRFAIGRAVLDGHVEEMNFAVDCGHSTGRIKKDRRVVGAQGIGRALGQAAQQDPSVRLAGQVGETLGQRAGNVRRGFAEPGQWPSVLQHFGQGDQARVMFASLQDESRGAVDVGRDVLIGRPAE